MATICKKTALLVFGRVCDIWALSMRANFAVFDRIIK